MALAELWERVRERVLSRVDRITHTSDRKAAKIRATRRTRPGRVVLVCYGNICRSPYAAAYLRRRLAEGGVEGVDVDSAGLIGPGRPANRQGAAIALERGLDLSGHRSRLFLASDSARADLVLVMTRRQREQLVNEFGVPVERIELLGDFDAEDPPFREIADPYGKSDEVFTRVFLQIERCVDGLCACWTEQAPKCVDERSVTLDDSTS